ncbi:MAG: MFS transporter [Anaerolineales bacterium]|nr:MFS transporter [Anaerolineales bacterium]
MKRFDSYKIYLFLVFTSSALYATAFTAMSLYEVKSAGLNPLQLVLVGTTLELTVLLCEVPTGVVADVYSRRLSVILGHGLMGLGFLLEGLFPHFLSILLAQVLWGLGYTFSSGATQAWLSDEIGEEGANRAFLTANRVGLTGALLGMLAAVGLGSFTSPAMPILVSGAGHLMMAGLLILLMSETGFKPTKPEDRTTFQHRVETFRKGLGIVRARPALTAILGVALFYGLYSEGFDRLWVKHLLDHFTLPVIFGNNDVAFFGFLRAASMLLSIAATRLVEKRLDTRNLRSIGRFMLGITVSIAATIVAFALSPFLGLTIGLYLVVSALRSLVGPLMDMWMNQHLDSDARATVLSMTGQADAAGQIAGGPLIGLLANGVSVPLAMSISGGLLTPALGFVARANRIHALPVPEDAPAQE